MLTQDQANDLIGVLLDAFPIRVQFAQMMYTRVGKSLDGVAATGALETDIFRVIQDAEAQGWTGRLLTGAVESRPGSEKLIEFMQQLKMSPTSKSRSELELLIKASNDFLDVAAWRAALGAAELRICRVEVPLLSGGISYGTGFLVGTSTVLTNYHVMEPVLKKKARPEEVCLRFDFKRLEDGVTLNQGTVYPLAAEWEILSSPYSEADLFDIPGILPAGTELDFALLRVKGTPANDRASRANADVDSPKRGFFTFPSPPIHLAKDAPLLILQHPDGDYLKLAIDTEAGLETNQNNTRLRYTTNTLPGSSGSPCFNIDWQLVAVHHLGDPNFPALKRAKYNQGVPVEKIHTFIRSKGLENALA